jgi:hypothetical protein
MDGSVEPIPMSEWIVLNALDITVFVFGLLLWVSRSDQHHHGHH